MCIAYHFVISAGNDRPICFYVCVSIWTYVRLSENLLNFILTWHRFAIKCYLNRMHSCLVWRKACDKSLRSQCPNRWRNSSTINQYFQITRTSPWSINCNNKRRWLYFCLTCYVLQRKLLSNSTGRPSTPSGMSWTIMALAPDASLSIGRKREP